MTEGDGVETASLFPAEAFAVLSNETRVAIVETLAEESGLSFAELRKRVGVSDAGQFNYHLSKLQDRFVSKRDGEYHPQYAALRAVGAIRSGIYTSGSTTETKETDYDCPTCESLLTATYDRGKLFLECDEHEKVFQTMVPPTAASNRTIEALLSYANAEVQRDIEHTVDGNCHICTGPLSCSSPERPENLLQVVLSCENCWNYMHLPVAVTVVRHPAVVSLYHDHGIDVRSEPLLSLDFVRDPESASVLSEDPVRMRVTVELGEDTLQLTLDGELNVLETERE
ncbi:winged helix-turn-helix domain-containing protein [Halorussus halophilus]|uniref:winged helix-turn-helix domain-containing protein n=1 Tax=Halorussus halophilus TaxID=2650975 RepID=UPI001300E5D1|nr:helix-turn-helix domain-containing protein [Halorussus halophilus]